MSRKIGEVRGKGVWVKDGHVYILDRWLDYFEFCRRLRDGQYPSFIPENNFHLSG